jgi:predicted TIM-barrel fold metal-dependent hydrolase
MTAVRDSNVILGSWPTDQAPTLSVPGLLAEMDRLGIGEALVRHADAVNYDPAIGNTALLAAVAEQPRLRPAFVVGPLDCGEHGGPAGLADQLTAHRVSAAWIYPTRHGWQVAGPEATTLLGELRRAGLPLFVDLDECGWSDIDVLARNLPDVDIVVCGIGYRTLRQAFAVLGEHPRVRLDTSFLSAHNGLELIAARFGVDRLVFGSGAPVRDAAGAVYRLATSGLTDAQRNAVSGDVLTAPEAATPAGGIVDAHAHIGAWPSSFAPDATDDALITGMDRTGTAVAIASSMRALWSGEVRTGNTEMLAAAQRHPGRLYGYAVANPHFPQDRHHLDELLDRDEMRGIKIHPHTHGCALDDPRYDWICELAAAHGVPVLAHTFADTWHSDPRLLGPLAARHPAVAFIAGHAGASAGGFRTTIEIGNRQPNVHAEICGSAMTGWWLRRIVDGLGADRVLHGTDATLIDPRYAVGRLVRADLLPEERALIAAGNARRLFRLTLHPPH